MSVSKDDPHYPGRAPIDGYEQGGFRFAGMSHRGSLLCLPSGVHSWTPANPEALTDEDFARVLAEAAGFQMLLVGTGLEPRPLGPKLRAFFRERKIPVDPMTTGAAVRTYNVLLAEDRAVAAALIAVD